MTDFYDEYIKLYYKKVFPAELFFQWLGLGNESTFSKREFSFTLQSDVYIRYQSFINANELLEELKKKNPKKIDIGAVYNMCPNQHKTFNAHLMKPEWKEFVIDIDLTDYDDVRFCCSKADVCSKCWTLMTAGIRILDRFLREDLELKHVLWVFSGRRGVHCWVADRRACNWDNRDRDAFTSFLSCHGPGAKFKGGWRRQDIWRSGHHPHLDDSLAIAGSLFQQYALDDQKLLERPEGLEYVLSTLPESLSEGRDAIRAQWSGPSKSESEEGVSRRRWKRLTEYLYEENNDHIVGLIIMQIMYPRLDVNVSKTVNHLLKSPFCVHPATGKVCIPLDLANLDQFNPSTSPTMQQVLDQMGGANPVSVENSVLGPALKIFQHFVKDLRADLDR